MSKCQKTKATCLDIAVDKIIKSVDALNKSETKEYYKPKSVAIIAHSTPKLTMPIIVQNEERNLPRFIELVMQNKSIGEVIAIDGGSTDKTVSLLKKAGAKVYIHPYIKTYHEQQAMQRNISCSYVADGTKIIIMDIDECFSDELSAYLPELAGSAFEYGLISRRTFKLFKDIKNPGKQIKDYPDWQPRFYTWNRKYKFVGGAHHVTLNCPEPVKIQKDIIHFEEEGKDRQAIEKQWSSMMTGVKQLMR
jgi:glycosyltransferase involved in cell wall biosynthesis